MKVGKPKSKRVPVRLRHKIAKASNAKQRKERKLARKNPEWRSRLKKDPGIPNLFPYKDRILHEIEEGKRRKEEEASKKREQAKARREGRAVGDEAIAAEEEDDELLLDDELSDEEEMEDAPTIDDSSNPMAALLASARVSAKKYEQENGMAPEEDEMDEDGSDDADDAPLDAFVKAQPSTRKDTSRRAFDQAFKQVLADSDVLLYVLDARDPLGTRSQTIEQAITADPSKRLILILNKIDLVPPHTLKAWLLHLRRSFPTLPFRGAGSSSSATVKPFDHKHLTPQFTANNLIRALKAFANARDPSAPKKKGVTTVGILGYPNSGKSTLINALSSRLSGAGPRKSGKECPVGAEAGITTAVRAIKLDKQITLLDSPGIVFPSSQTSAKKPTPSSTSGKAAASTTASAEEESQITHQAKLILLNAVPPREIADPIPSVTLLLDRLAASSDEIQLQTLHLYGIAPGTLRSTGADRTTDFLVHVARARGRLGKGGVPNLDAAARTVLGDWREGRIRGWAEPPVVETVEVKGAQGDQKQIVTKWAKEFKIEGLWGGETDEGDNLQGGDVEMS